MSLWRSELAEKTMTKLELAQRQLETAIGLFVSRRYRQLKVWPADGIQVPLDYTRTIVLIY